MNFDSLDPNRSSQIDPHSNNRPIEGGKKPESKTVDDLRKIGISATRLLPFSSRGIVINILKAPIRLGQSIAKGYQAYKKGDSFSEAFKEKFGKLLQKDWVGGISDYYTRVDTKTENLDAILDNQKYFDTTKRILTPEETKMWKDYTPKEIAHIELKYGDPNLPEEDQKIVEDLHQKFGELNFTQGKNGTYYNQETGTCFRLCKIGNEIVVSFLGWHMEAQATGESARHLNNPNSLAKQLAANVRKNIFKNFFGGIDKASLLAMDIGKILKETCEEHTNEKQPRVPVVTGVSHGGGLAQCAAAKNGIKGVLFLPRPMGASIRRYIGIDNINRHAKNITAFSIKHELLTGTSVLNVLSTWIERIFGIPMPRTVAGNAYQLPDPSGEFSIMRGIDLHGKTEDAFEKLKKNK